MPLVLGGGLIAVAALASLGEAPLPGEDYARGFVNCADRVGAGECGRYLDEWSKRPNARREMIDVFARNKAFALHLLAMSDAEILTGSIRRGE
ncbi:MAG: hypothetical protein WBF87_14380 [Mesorhizobium sp.]